MTVRWMCGLGLLVGLSEACGGKGPNDGADGSTGADGTPDSGVAADGASGDATDDGSDEGDGAGDGVDGGAGEDPCVLVSCGRGQRCELVQGTATCVDNTCADLACGATEECAPAVGGGSFCDSIACDSDVQCGQARYCDGAKCVDDICEPSAQRCEDGQVYQCASNGGEDVARFTCQGDAYFESTCTTGAGAAAGCSCEDDWDCPDFTLCNAGTCQGTGVAPTCTLPAQPFAEVLPTLEFRWGGSSAASPAATGKPFPDHAQVVGTPAVANLDDDNGDGLIDELDFPEVIFMAYAAGNVHHSGVVRALHAGGPARGQDYFALCDTKHWFEGDPVDAMTCAADEATSRPGGGLAVGDLDDDGRPEIVLGTERGTLLILNHRGEIQSESAKVFIGEGEPDPNDNAWKYPQVSLVNLDNRGFAEVVVGHRVLTLQKSEAGVLEVQDVFIGARAQGAPDDAGSQERHFGPTSCPANLVDASPSDDDVSQEIVVGTSLYALPTPPSGVTRRAECASGDVSDFCAGVLTLVWDARDVNGTTGDLGVPNVEGYCAVADLLGADRVSAPGPLNPLDHAPEVVLVSNGRVLVLGGSDGKLLRKIDVEPGMRGGAPNVDDFDGDGFPEVAMASSGFYTVIDLQDASTACPTWPNSLGSSDPAPGTNAARSPGDSCASPSDCAEGAACNTAIGQCVCLHNGWKRVTEDDSSRATSSSIFDFNGDGAAEVVYGDECYFRVYDGASGDVQLAVPSVSRTVLENPVVSDVDNDGNAEIVFVSNNETLQCSQSTLVNPDGTTVEKTALPNGIEVWGDASDTWVSARRIWNEHAYHVTNVTESGRIPTREPESFRPYGARVYNTYRSQPRSFGVAPDLTLVAMQVSSPDVACGQLSDELQITVLVQNVGDLRVGPGVVLSFEGTWAGVTTELRDAGGAAITATLQTSLEPGASLLVSARFDAGEDPHGTLPERVRVRVDASDAERECREDNNELAQDVSGGEQLADLRLELGAATGSCQATEVRATVHNDGAVSASDVLVRIYAGDPSAGGHLLGEQVVAGPIGPGESAAVQVPLAPLDRTVTLYGIADPLDAIRECNSANNLDRGEELVCGVVL